jgi:hypothetical protein
MAATDYDFKLNRNQLIASAFRKVGVLPPGDELPAELLAVGVETLNLIVKEWQAKRVFLWSEIWLADTLSDGVASYAFPTATPILGLSAAYYRTTATGEDEPLQLISWQDYCDIAEKAEEGEPTKVALCWAEEKFYFYPVPDKTYYFKALAIQKLKDFDTASGTGDVADRFQRALIFATAADLAFEFNPSREAALRREANTAWMEVKGSDRERVTSERVKGAHSI